MIFYGRRTTAHLAFAKPLDICCNCGRDCDISLIETPLLQTRFFLVYGTQLELRESFPYCRECRRSATRVRPGMPAKLLMSCLTTAVLFLVIVMAESVLPQPLRESPFRWSLALGVVSTFAYFVSRESLTTPRTYYQPVRLAGVRIAHGQLQWLHLAFANAAYAKLFAAANADATAAGVLQVYAAV